MTNDNIVFNVYDSIAYDKAFFWKNRTEVYLKITPRDGATLLKHIRYPYSGASLIPYHLTNNVDQLKAHYDKRGKQRSKQQAKYLNVISSRRSIDDVMCFSPFRLQHSLKRI